MRPLLFQGTLPAVNGHFLTLSPRDLVYLDGSFFPEILFLFEYLFSSFNGFRSLSVRRRLGAIVSLFTFFSIFISTLFSEINAKLLLFIEVLLGSFLPLILFFFQFHHLRQRLGSVAVIAGEDFHCQNLCQKIDTQKRVFMIESRF